ncbi:hypothetical protein Q5762_07525 [Streptomyces sp. P9(2023)]|uniref:hypothetical protein n=1 Tax=Streptomyces sp. P9(2023) TaxID=3064394 RepID=UPI0028F41F45|nr:hypothetical protein [Streptomyces sp. P9(2023)]MDT9688206.1 hypothetical protein [Streptomyces sp. P9(2023)]
MATTYRITYRVLPEGVGPEDYEPADLETRIDLVEASDPEEAGVIAGEMRRYLPSYQELGAALGPKLAVGEHPIITKVEIATEA